MPEEGGGGGTFISIAISDYTLLGALPLSLGKKKILTHKTSIAHSFQKVQPTWDNPEAQMLQPLLLKG